MADEKNPKKVEEEVKTLRQEMDAITFKNKQAKEIAAIQAGKEKLKDKLSKNRERRVGAASKISGLGRLQGLATFKTK
jgi:ABC-type nitrate/sulfonate/bicarbonate transport system substrate-binding protein